MVQYEEKTDGTLAPVPGPANPLTISSVAATTQSADGALPSPQQVVAEPSYGSTPDGGLSTARCIALVATVSGASFLNTFSSQASVIILPTISNDLNIPPSRQQWVISSYLITLGCFLMLWGRVADVYGKRTMFILGSLEVTLAAAITPLMPTEATFDLLRALQGIGAAANVPTSIGIIGSTFSSGKARTWAFGFYSAGTPLGSVMGNLIAGFISSYTTWKWVFGVTAIFAAITTIAGFFAIPNPPFEKSQDQESLWKKIDWIGAVLITAGLLCLLFALTEGNVVGWSKPYIGSLIAVSILIIAGFVWWQHLLEKKPGKDPLIKISVFRYPHFSAVIATMAILLASFNGYLVYVTLFYQDYQGLSPLQTTLRFIPTGVTGVLMAIGVSPLLMRVPASWVLASASVFLSVSSLLFAVRGSPDGSYFTYGLWAMILATCAADTAIPCLYLFVSHSLPSEDQAVGGAVLNVAMQVGRVLGLAITTVVQTVVMADARGVSVQDAGQIEKWDSSSLAGLKAAFWMNFALGMCSFLIVAIFLRNSGVIGRKKK